MYSCGLCAEVGGLSEVVEREDVRAALGRRRDDLRRVDLGEPSLIERGAEASDRRGCELEHGAAARVAKRDGSVVEQRRQLLAERRPAQLDRRRLGSRDDADAGIVQLDAAGCGVDVRNLALDVDDGLRLELSDFARVPVRR